MSAEGWDGTWVENPPARGPFVWPKRLEPLRENPGEWAKFGPFSFMGTGKQVGLIKHGRYGQGFDAYRKSEFGRDWIYVSFTGQPELEIVPETQARSA